MARKVTAMDVRMASALAGAVENVAAFCREQEISRQTYYKWQARVAAEGVAGLQERSRRPHRSPGATPFEVEDLIVTRRKQLADDGLDHGPASIRWSLLTDLGAARLPAAVTVPAVTVPAVTVPAVSTIARILVRRGLVTPAPQKRPHSSYHRFVAARPNELWQSDWTQWALADETPVAIAATLDDHSRVLVGIAAELADATARFVWSVMLAAISVFGVPATSLTDNGLVYSMARRGGQAAFEINLRALGCHPICSSPYHPQTCGKIERFWQTLKKWLTAHGPYPTLEALNADLAVFAELYNHHRPHRALHGATPHATYTAGVKARPADRPLPAPTRVEHNRVTGRGALSVGRYEISVGTAWAGHTLDIVHDDQHVVIFAGNQLVRALTLDPARSYQPAEPGRVRTYRYRHQPH